MSVLRSNRLLYFGPLTVIVEWLGILLASFYFKDFTLDMPGSLATTQPWPLPLIFGVTLTTAAISYFLFSLPLSKYSRFVPYTAAVGGLAWIVTAWTPFTGTNNRGDMLHNFFSWLAVWAYIALVWQLRKHPLKQVARFTKVIFYMLLMSALFSYVSWYVLHRYTGLIQFIVLVLIQIWTIHIVWHTRKLA